MGASGKIAQLYDVGNGELLTMRQIIEQTGINESTLYARRAAGKTGAELIETPDKGRCKGYKYIDYKTEFNNKVWTATEIAKTANISTNSVRNRMNSGWAPEDLFLPSDKKRGRKDQVQDKPPKREAEPQPPYTDAELYELYKGFAGYPDELSILAAFMGVSDNLAKDKLQQFKARYASAKHHRQPPKVTRQTNPEYMTA